MISEMVKFFKQLRHAMQGRTMQNLLKSLQIKVELYVHRTNYWIIQTL